MPAFVLPSGLPIVIAPFVGSFLGVVVQRVPERRPIVISRSACAGCGSPLRPHELVPLLSFVWQRGRCRHCSAPIGWFHPAIEGAALTISVWSMLTEATQPAIWTTCLLGWTLLTLACIDIRCFRLPDLLTLPLLLAGLGLTASLAPDQLFLHALGAACGYGALRGIALTYRMLRRREGLGAGDAKLLAAAGAWLGIGALSDVVLFAAVTGLAWAAACGVAGRQVRSTTALPFGPCLALGFWLAWLARARWGLS